MMLDECSYLGQMDSVEEMGLESNDSNMTVHLIYYILFRNRLSECLFSLILT